MYRPSSIPRLVVDIPRNPSTHTNQYIKVVLAVPLSVLHSNPLTKPHIQLLHPLLASIALTAGRCNTHKNHLKFDFSVLKSFFTTLSPPINSRGRYSSTELKWVLLLSFLSFSLWVVTAAKNISTMPKTSLHDATIHGALKGKCNKADGRARAPLLNTELKQGDTGPFPATLAEAIRLLPTPPRTMMQSCRPGRLRISSSPPLSLFPLSPPTLFSFRSFSSSTLEFPPIIQ